jgi:lysozyme family protein
MATFGQLVDFIKTEEGGISSSPYDTAKADPVIKDGAVLLDKVHNPAIGRYKGHPIHTNCGITWATWKQNAARLNYPPTAEMFLEMPDQIWQAINRGYWNAVLGDELRHQTVANHLCEFAWGSGPATAVRRAQQVLRMKYDRNIAVDGVIGPQTVRILNSVADERQLFLDLHEDRLAFLNHLLTLDKYKANVGWIPRMERFRQFQLGVLGG